MVKKVLVTLSFSPDMITGFDSSLDILRSKGFEVTVDPRYRTLTQDELIPALEGAYAHVIAAETISEEVLEQAPNLKVLSRMGIGYDHVDVDASSKRGVAVTITPGANAEAVAEHTMALMMTLTRKIKMIDAKTREGVWQSHFGVSLYRKTLGVIGTGNIGKCLIQNVSGFDMKIIAYDVYQDKEFAAKHNVTYVPLETLLKESDFISVHIPYTNESKHLLGEKEFAMMKPSAQLINCARGEIIDEQAMYKALVEKQIAGAALDVFEQEPINMDNPLLTLDNVLVTSHTSGMTFEGRKKVVDMAFQNVIDISEGKKPFGLINPQIFD